jgi:hypothetical protein
MISHSTATTTDTREGAVESILDFFPIKFDRHYFHFPTTKSKEYTRHRQAVTQKYGVITTLILLGLLLLIPALNYLKLRGYYGFHRIHVLRSLNLRLNKYIITGNELHPCRRRRWRYLISWFAQISKELVFKVTYHANALIQITFWLFTLSSLSLTEIHHGDLIFLAKRLGRIATVSLPTILFLTLRPSPFPHTLYLNLLVIHKWLSRLIIVEAILHTIIYCANFQRQNTWKKAWKTENVYGWVALLGFVAILITSLLKLRDKSYRLFYINHYFFSWVIVGTLQFHVRPYKITKYTVVNVCILVGQIVYRLFLSRRTSSPLDVKVIDISPNLSLVEFPNSLIAQPALNPGAHIRFNAYHSNFIVRGWNQIFPIYHPYTLASLPQDNYQRLIVRKSNFKILNNRKYIVCGSYDPHILFINSRNTPHTKFSIHKLNVQAKRVLMVVGGSAISFALPILRVMNYHGIPIKIVWVLKDFLDVNALRYFDGFVHGDDFEIFVTGTREYKERTHDGISRHASYASLGGRSLRNHFRFGSVGSRYSVSSEISEDSPLLSKYEEEIYDEFNSLTRENEIEDVDVEVDNIESEDEECPADQATRSDLVEDFANLAPVSDENSEIDSENDENDVNSIFGEHLSPTHSGKTNTSFNDPFIPIDNSTSESARLHLKQYHDTVKKLNLEHRIYSGRPILNYKYFNWCINEGFTQCSGPVQDGDNQFVCCRDLPRNRVVPSDIDAEKLWVISAGPKGLVNNVKLWANEYGLKFHEEAFYV